MKTMLKWIFAVFFVIGAACPLFAFGQRDLPEIPDPPPANMATIEDVAALRDEVIRLNEELLALHTYCLQLDDYCTRLQDMLISLAKCNSFEEVRKILKDKYGINVTPAFIQAQQDAFKKRIAKIIDVSGIVTRQKVDIANIKKDIRLKVTPRPSPR